MKMTGQKILDQARTLIWRNLCMIGPQYIECIVEFSKHKSKFFILAYDLFSKKYHIIELFYN